jgi:Protein of unknown function (DUF1091)
VAGRKKNPVMPMPTFNYCDAMRGKSLPMQVVKAFLGRMAKFGRLAVPCPIQPGHYYLKNFYVDETHMPMYRLLREGLVIMLEVDFNQEVLGKMVPVMHMESYFTCNKSNWP